jgi:hypothetical protein
MMKKLGLLAIASLAVAACGGGGSSPPPNNTTSSNSTPASTTPPAASSTPASSSSAATPTPAASGSSAAGTDVKPQAFQETDDPSEAPKEGKAALADGRPKDFKAGAAESVWIWQDAKGVHWHVRTSTAEKTHRFHGAIIGDGEIKNMKSVKTEAGDRWKMKGKRASFDFYTTSAADGLDFDVGNNSCVRFVLFIDGKPAPADRIMLGKDSAHPQAANFKLCP